MPARRRIVRLIDRLSLAGHPASEALLTRAMEAGAYTLGLASGRLRRLLAPHVEDRDLTDAWQRGVRSSQKPPAPRGMVLPFPDRR